MVELHIAVDFLVEVPHIFLMGERIFTISNVTLIRSETAHPPLTFFLKAFAIKIVRVQISLHGGQLPTLLYKILHS